MVLGKVLIVDEEPGRLAVTCDWLRGHGYETIGADSESAAAAKLETEKPDMILLRLGIGTGIFHKLASISSASGTFIVPFVERNFSSDQRREVLSLKADGFLNEQLPEDELIASVHALAHQHRTILELRRRIEDRNGEKCFSRNLSADLETSHPSEGNVQMHLRERSPELYRDVLVRYEEAVKLVLRHRIYKISDDIFEPFRHIARELFLANATARDAVELHYQTMRKIVPTPDAPRAQAYLEVGRTTIIGLMGDLLTFYRTAHQRGAANANSSPQGSGETRS